MDTAEGHHQSSRSLSCPLAHLGARRNVGGKSDIAIRWPQPKKLLWSWTQMGGKDRDWLLSQEGTVPQCPCRGLLRLGVHSLPPQGTQSLGCAAEADPALGLGPSTHTWPAEERLSPGAPTRPGWGQTAGGGGAQPLGPSGQGRGWPSGCGMAGSGRSEATVARKSPQTPR